MKTLFLLLHFAAMISFADLKSQETSVYQLKGKLELSPAFSFSSIKERGSEGQWYLTVPVRVTYFVSDNFGLGGEVIFTEQKEDKNTGIVASLLLEGDLPTSQGTILYLLGGVGLSNSMVIDRLALRYTEKGPSLVVFSLGGGAKIPLIKNVFGKIEIRYQYFSGKQTYEDFFGETITDKVKTNYVNAVFGISLIL